MARTGRYDARSHQQNQVLFKRTIVVQVATNSRLMVVQSTRSAQDVQNYIASYIQIVMQLDAILEESTTEQDYKSASR